MRGNGKYKDLLIDTATEEIADVEMIATLIARLLNKAPDAELEDAAKDPIIAAILGGSNPQHVIVSGLGAMPGDWKPLWALRTSDDSPDPNTK